MKMYNYIKYLSVLLVWGFLSFINSVLAENKIYQLRSNSLKDKLQIVMDVEDSPQFKAFALSNPPRIVADIKALVTKQYRGNLNFKNRGVSIVRTGVRHDNEVRLVLDLKKDFAWRAYALPANAKRGARLVIDIFDVKGYNPPISAKANNVRPTTTEKIGLESVVTTDTKYKKKRLSKQVVKQDKPTKSLTTKNIKQRDINIVIDPGHGGKDSGAVGAHRTKEKVIVLKVAKLLKRKIDAIKGMRAILTRTTDRYIPLRGRLNFARKHKADLFISVHADAFRDFSAKGASVFILSNHGASSEAARWLAKGENSVDIKYGGVDVGDYNKDIGDVMIKIQQDATIESSYILADKTLSQLNRIGRVHQKDVERAGFVVLKSPDIPSMLVETAFISNPEEEKRLNSPAYQEKLASSIAKGVENYFKIHLPHYLLLVEPVT
ncbi:MAG: N-acetylmuramoyl-L-alanine amidase [Ostreibacterium sp.]